MLSLEHLKDSYGFNQAKWKTEEQTLETEKGNKSLSKWTDESNVRWHVQWRDLLAERTGCLTNRMIRSLHGERIILIDTGWVTLHDEVTSLFSYKKREQEMGLFFGQYFSLGMEEKTQEVVFNDPFVSIDFQSYLQRPYLSKERDEEARFLERMRKESLLRYRKAKDMREKAGMNTGTQPIVSPILSLDQGRMVYGRLYWLNTNEQPEKGYSSLRIILLEWLQRYGQTSLFILLDEINKEFDLKGYHGRLLLADALVPWEFIDYVNKTKHVKDKEELLVWKEKLTYQWEAARLLVKALGEWHDVSREKVTL